MRQSMQYRNDPNPAFGNAFKRRQGSHADDRQFIINEPSGSRTSTNGQASEMPPSVFKSPADYYSMASQRHLNSYDPNALSSHHYSVNKDYGTHYQGSKFDHSPHTSISGQGQYPNRDYTTNFEERAYSLEKDIRSINKEHQLSPAREQMSISGVDMEGMIVNLHQKMKNLEGKYIQLANFYKQELIQKKDIKIDKNRFMTTTQASRSRSRSPGQPDMVPTIDHLAESHIIRELRHEKSNFEKELEGMYSMQQLLQQQPDESIHWEQKLAIVEEENARLRQTLNTNTTHNLGSSPHHSPSPIDNFKDGIMDTLDQFENEFLQYINQNYNSFTENDVKDLFSNLQKQLLSSTEQYASKVKNQQRFGQTNLMMSNQHTGVAGMTQDVAKQLDDDRNVLMQEYFKDLDEFELSQQYRQQDLKKSVFSLKNKHDRVKLDLKKMSMHLDTLNLAVNDGRQMNSSLESDPRGHNRVDINKRVSSASRMAWVDRSTPTNLRVKDAHQRLESSPSPIAQYNSRYSGDLGGIVKAVQGAFNDLNAKVVSSEKEIHGLNQMAEEDNQGLTALKQNYQSLIDEVQALQIPTLPPNWQRKTQTSEVATASETLLNEKLTMMQEDSQKQICELKAINDKLFKELQLTEDRYSSVKMEFHELQNQLQPHRGRSPMRIIDSPVVGQVQGRSSSLETNIYDLNQRRRHTKENNSDAIIDQLTREIGVLQNNLRDMTANVDERDAQLRQLQFELSQHRRQSLQTETPEHLASKSHPSADTERLQILLKLTQRFIYAMKKLQKAVHRKEPDVSRQKQDYEITKKELESAIKQLKRDLQNDDGESNPIYMHATHTEAIPQNRRKQTNTISSSSQVHPIHHYSMLEQNKNSTQRSPIPLRTTRLKHPRMQEMFRSIEASSDHNHLVLPSSGQKRDKFRAQHHSRDESAGSNKRHRVSTHLSTFDNDAALYQQDTMGQNRFAHVNQERENLRKEVSDVAYERDQLRVALTNYEGEITELKIHNDQIQTLLDRDKRKHEATRRELNDVLHEKEALFHQYSKLSNDFEHLGHSKSHLNQVTELQRLRNQLESVEMMNSEYRRTIDYMKETDEVAKRTITDLKEALTSKELGLDDGIGMSSGQMTGHNQPKRSARDRRESFSAMKKEVKGQIEDVSQMMEAQLGDLQTRVDEKEQEIGRVKRQMERKLKEREMHLVNQKEHEVQDKIGKLQQQIREMQGDQTQSKELARLKQEKEAAEKEVQDLKGQVEKSTKHKQKLTNSHREMVQTQEELEKQVKEVQDLNQKLMNEADKWKLQAKDLEKQLKENQARAGKEESQQIAEMTSTLASVQNELRIKNIDIQMKEQQCSEAEDNLTRVTREKQKLTKENQQATTKATKAEVDAKAVDLQREKAEIELQKQLSVIADTQAKLKSKEQELNLVKEEQARKLRYLQFQQEQTQTKLQDAESNLKDKQAELDRLTNDLQQHRSSLQKKDSEVSQTRQELAYKSEEVERAKLNASGQQRQAEEAAQQQLKELQGKLQEAIKERMTLGQQHNREKNQLQEQINAEKDTAKELETQKVLLEEKLSNAQKAHQDTTQEMQEKVQTSKKEAMNAQKHLKDLEKQSIDLQSQLNKNSADHTKAQTKAQQNQKDIEELQQKVDVAEKERKEAEDKLKQLDREGKFMKAIKENLEKKIAEMEDQHRDQILEKDGDSKQQASELSKKLQEAMASKLFLETQAKDLKTELDNFKSAKHGLEKEVSEARQDHKTTEEQLHDLQRQYQTSLKELKVEQKRHMQAGNEKDQKITSLKDENNKLFAQVQSLLNENESEKKSIQDQLSQQVSDLRARQAQLELDLELKRSQAEVTERTANDRQNKVDEITAKYQELEQARDELQEEVRQHDEKRNKHSETLTQNRDIIQKLSDELKKTMELSKSNEKLATQHEAKIQELQDQVNILKQQNANLRTDSDDKLMDLQMRIDEQEIELKLRNDLIEEANRLIEDFNDDKHAIKAKFKHLMHLYQQDPNGVESSYKEDDDIDLEECFERLEKVLLGWKDRQEFKLEQLEMDKEALTEQIDQSAKKQEDVERQLKEALEKCEVNDGEMRSQMNLAARKIQNYKDKLIEKQKYINELEENKDSQKSPTTVTVKEKSHNEDEVLELQTENLQLIQRLQKAENELQKERASNTGGGAVAVSIDQSVHIDLQKIATLEESLMDLQKKVFEAKDHVISQLEREYLQEMRKIQDVYFNEQILKKAVEQPDNVDWINNQVKECKRVSFDNKSWLLVSNVATGIYYILAESALSETQLRTVRQYLPNMESHTFAPASHQDQLVQNLSEQITEIKEERQELQQELLQYKQKILQNLSHGDLDLSHQVKDTETRLLVLEDDVQHFTSENHELRIKIKDLVQHNNELKIRAVELNNLMQDLTVSSEKQASPAEGNRLLKLLEEKEALQKQVKALQNERDQQYDEEQKRATDFVADDDNSFLADIKAIGDASKPVANTEKFGKGGFFDQSSIQDGDNDSVDAQQLKSKIKKLENDLDDAKNKNKTLTAEMARSQETLNAQETSVIEHIKGTLIQFLKNCPLTEKTNEELLAIVFSMMEFSKDEVHDVQSFRQKIREGGDDEEAKRAAKKGIFNIFKKKERDSSQKPRAPASASPSPLKPIGRH